MASSFRGRSSADLLLKQAAVDDGGMLYEGVRRRRTVGIHPSGYVIDMYWVSSQEPHEYAWLLRLPAGAELVSLSVPVKPQPVFGEEREFGWLRNVRCGETAEPWRAEWDVEGVRYRLSLAGGESTTVVLADFPRTQDYEPPPIPLIAAVRSARGTVFTAIHQAARSGEALQDVAFF